MQIQFSSASLAGIIQTAGDSKSALGARIKTIGLTALLAISFLTACYCIYRSFFFRGSIPNDDPPIGPALAESPLARSYLDIGNFIRDCRARISVPQHCISAKCFITLEDKDKNFVRNSFIFTPSNGEVFDQRFFDTQLVKVLEYFEGLDAGTSNVVGINSCVIFMTSEKEGRLQFHGGIIDKRSSSHGLNSNYSGGISTFSYLGAQGLGIFLNQLRDELGFPVEKQVENGKFCQGQFFQQLPH